jgi:hypothetical protein
MKGSIVSIFHIKNYSFILILQTDLPTLSIKITHHRSCCLFFFIPSFLTVIISVYANEIFCQCLPMDTTMTYLVRKILRNYRKYFFIVILN